MSGDDWEVTVMSATSIISILVRLTVSETLIDSSNMLFKVPVYPL